MIGIFNQEMQFESVDVHLKWNDESSLVKFRWSESIFEIFD